MNENHPLDLKYRPSSLSHGVYKNEILETVGEIIKQNKVFRLLIVDKNGTGKTSLANILQHEMGLELFFVNTQLCNKAEIKENLIDFCSTQSVEQKPKFVLFDEFDNADVGNIQKPLLPLLEQFKNVSFMFTANDGSKITEALKSRCKSLELTPTNKEERLEILKNLIKRLIYICDNEKIEYTKKQLLDIIKHSDLDIRACIVTLDSSIVDNKIEKISHCGLSMDYSEFKEIIKSYSNIIDFVNNDPFLSPSSLLEYIYTNVIKEEKLETIQTKLALILHANQKCTFINPKIFMTGVLLELKTVITEM